MKSLKILVATVLGLILIAGNACSGESEAPAPTPTPAANKVNVDASYNGSDVTLAVDDLLVITLDSNPGSTGLSWNLSAISDAAIIQYVSDEYVVPEESDPPTVGQGGQEVWTFEALDDGTATISMKYNRPTVPQEIYNSFEITVTVE